MDRRSFLESIGSSLLSSSLLGVSSAAYSGQAGSYGTYINSAPASGNRFGDGEIMLQHANNLDLVRYDNFGATELDRTPENIEDNVQQVIRRGFQESEDIYFTDIFARGEFKGKIIDVTDRNYPLDEFTSTIEDSLSNLMEEVDVSIQAEKGSVDGLKNSLDLEDVDNEYLKELNRENTERGEIPLYILEEDTSKEGLTIFNGNSCFVIADERQYQELVSTGVHEFGHSILGPTHYLIDDDIMNPYRDATLTEFGEISELIYERLRKGEFKIRSVDNDRNKLRWRYDPGRIDAERGVDAFFENLENFFGRNNFRPEIQDMERDSYREVEVDEEVYDLAVYEIENGYLGIRTDDPLTARPLEDMDHETRTTIYV